jgi:NADH-quinone oxidoreductase subunit K
MINNFLSLSFCFLLINISICGFFFSRTDFVLILITLEIHLLLINTSFLTISQYLNDYYGQCFTLIVLTVAASESAIGIALVIMYYKTHNSIILIDSGNIRH